MADIFQLLVDILKITPQQVSQYAAQGPLYQMFYLFVFPTVFIIVFIYILSYRAMRYHAGLRVVIAMVVYAFIILGGYYKWFVILSGYWLLGLILLGFLFLLIGRGGESGGAKRMMSRNTLSNVKRALVGNRTLNPFEIGADQHVMSQEIKNIEEQIKAKRMVMKDTPKEQRGIIDAEIAELEAAKRDIQDRKKRFLKMQRS